MSWEDLEGHFNFSDVYDQAVEEAQDGDVLVEVGVLWGRSLAYLARRAIDSKKMLCIYGVDHWTDIDYQRFEAGMLHHAPEEFAYVRTICMDSRVASRTFRPCSCKFVFLDADHSLAAVRADIEAWQPRVQKGGYLAGHDYHQIDWPGVYQAVREKFGPIDPIGTERYCWGVRV